MKISSDIKKVADFWDARPCNVKHSELPIGSIDYVIAVMARRYTTEHDIVPFMTLGWANKKRLNILDIGCGIGSDSLFFAGLGHDVTGVDISDKSLDVARKGAKALGLKRVKFYKANIEELSLTLKPKIYDFIWSFGVIHHTPHPERVVKEIRKYCNRDTVVKIMLYNKWSWKAMILWLRDRSYKNSEAQPNFPFTSVYSKREARELLKDFDILDMKIDFIFPWKVDKYINYEYVHPWYWFILKHFQHILGWHILVTAKIKNV